MKKYRKIVAGILMGALVLLGSCLVQADKKESLVLDHSLELAYADQFSVDYYKDGYKKITIKDTGEFLLVPEGKEAPKGLGKEVKVLPEKVDRLYLVATSAMDFFRALDEMDRIRLSGTDADGWYIEEAREAIKSGKMLYAGKYSAPDYERIVSEGCGLAIESAMIYHTPEVKEKLEQFGIPVMVERSSYESHPLGRLEWIKLYGALLGKEEKAEEIFQEEMKRLEGVLAENNTGKTVAFFYVSSNGYVNVRKSGDYVSKMIQLAGGNYIFPDLGGEDNALSTMNMQMEEFYAKAKDADYLIYNSAIDSELTSLEELFDKSTLLKDFKAVKEGNVWCTEKNLFQETTGLGKMIEDIHTILTQESSSLDQLNYMHKLQ